MKELRKYLKSRDIEKNTPQEEGLEQPKLVKDYDEEARIIELPPISEDIDIIRKRDIFFCIEERETRRNYKDEPLTVPELSYLLWVTQGIRGIKKSNNTSKRSVPSAGGRHPLETYIAVNNVKGLMPGLYRYLPMEHCLVLEYVDKGIREKLVEAADRQIFIAKASLVFIWTALPERTEWRFGENALKYILLDAGHNCQNLYLACEALGLGTCAVAAYDQEKTDRLLGVDGKDEMAIYMAPVGRI